MLLSGCGSTTNTIVADGPKIPKSLLECSVEPKKPKGEFTQREVAVYILRLQAALRDCKGDLRSIRKILKSYEKKLEELRANKPSKES